MVERVETTFDITPQRLIGDTAYGTAPMLAWMVNEKAIELHHPCVDRTEHKDGTFSRSDFKWDAQANEYRCPADKALRCDRRPFRRHAAGSPRPTQSFYRASQRDCETCPEKARCCPNTPMRKSPAASTRVPGMWRAHCKTTQYKQSRCERKKLEMLFAHLKRILKLDRLRLRGLSGASDEWTCPTVHKLRPTKPASPSRLLGGIVAPVALENG